MARSRVTTILKEAGVEVAPFGKGRSRRPPSRHPSFEEIRRLYVDEGFSSTAVGAKLGLSDRTVRDVLTRSGVTLRHRGGFDRADRTPLAQEELEARYVEAGVPSEVAARLLNISHNTLLRSVHAFGLPVRDVAGRSDAPDRTVVLLDALYGAPEVLATLRRHRIPVVRCPGPVHERFPEPCALSDDALSDLYSVCGLSVFQIELVTGQASATVRHRLRRAGVQLRGRGGRSPFGRRLRGLEP